MSVASIFVRDASSPPPLWGRPGGGDSVTSIGVVPPTPIPSPQGGGGQAALLREEG
jgi:hypothetical protein